ncbi:hypothetical protein [Thalassotalea litorea]|uniref:hypothetical protein n=1 Tax=Thalassotalea litorea TaxID=2020715 RepID=UPI00373567C7
MLVAKHLYRLIFSLVMVIIIILLLPHANDKGYYLLLPLAFSIHLLICEKFKYYSKQFIAFKVLNIILWTRYFVLPIVIVFSNDINSYLIKVPTNNSLSLALIILLAELFTLTFIVQCFGPKIIKPASIYPISTVDKKWFLHIVLGISVIFLLVFPDLIGRYNFFIVEEALEKTTQIHGLVAIVGDLAFFILPILVLSWCYRRYLEGGDGKYYWMSLLVIIPFILFFKGSSRLSIIIPSLCWLSVLLKLYPDYKKATFKIISVVIITVFVSITLYKQFGAVSSEIGSVNSIELSRISSSLNAYFSGPYNIALASELNGVSVDTLLVDLIKNFALIGRTVDGLATTTDIFNEYLYAHNLYADQIVSVSGQGYIFFNVTGVIVFSAIFIFSVMFFCNALQKERRIEFIYILSFCSIYCAMYMMLNSGSIFGKMFNFMLPLFIVCLINRKFKFK